MSFCFLPCKCLLRCLLRVCFDIVIIHRDVPLVNPFLKIILSQCLHCNHYVVI
nr:MAG TPA: hypothetical protein [Caudoviricetes sp.]